MLKKQVANLTIKIKTNKITKDKLILNKITKKNNNKTCPTTTKFSKQLTKITGCKVMIPAGKMLKN